SGCPCRCYLTGTILLSSPLLDRSKAKITPVHTLEPRPDFAVAHDDESLAHVHFRCRPPVDHLGMDVPQGALLVRGLQIRNLAGDRVPAAAAVCAVAVHRQDCLFDGW